MTGMISMGFDIGGTTIKAGAVDENYRIIEKTSRPTPKDDPIALCDLIASLAKLLSGGKAIDTLGVTVPGSIDKDGGIFDAWNIGVRDFPLKKMIEQRIPASRVIIKNDADAEKFKAELEQHRAEADKAARERLRRMFIFRKIAAKESITVDEAQVAARLEAMAAYYGKKASELRKIMEGNGGLDTMRLEMLDEKVWRFLADKAEVSE